MQERLFTEGVGRVLPPEPGLYLGTSGWSYADWEGSLYPEGLPAASRLAEYVKRYATVEIDSTFYGTPRRSTVQKWREVAPEGFLFAAKFPQEITHEKNLVGCGELAANFVRTMELLGDRLGPLLLQLPPSFSVEGMYVLERFLEALPEGRYAVAGTGAGSAPTSRRCCGSAGRPSRSWTTRVCPGGRRLRPVSRTSGGWGIGESSRRGTRTPKRTGARISRGGPGW
ncbi:MAG: DUF72 domain-containing protein [Actinomycetota bacterium]|nr:DUF72 domain-containing protein [Actinomycetota bacterium]